jgi:hypothetical protein
MRSVHFGQPVAGGHENKQVAHLCKSQTLPRTLSNARKIHITGSQHYHGPSVSTISSQFDDYFKTVNKPDNNLKIEWKEKCHFMESLPTSKKSVQASDGVPNTYTNFANTNFQMDPLPTTVKPPAQIQVFYNMRRVMYQIKKNYLQISEQQSVKWSKQHKPSVQLQESIEQRNMVFISILDDIDGDEEI